MQGFFDFVKSLGAARMAAMAAVTLALIGFFSFLMIRMTTPQMVPLFTDLSMDDSAAIIKDLERQGVTYEIKNDGAIIMVPQGQGGAAAHEARRERPAQGRRRRLRDLRQVGRARRHHLHPEHQPSARARRRARPHHPQPRPGARRRACIWCCPTGRCSRATRSRPPPRSCSRCAARSSRSRCAPSAIWSRPRSTASSPSASRWSTRPASCSPTAPATTMRSAAPAPTSARSPTRTACARRSRPSSPRWSGPAARACRSPPISTSTASPRPPTNTIPTAAWCARARRARSSRRPATARPTARSRSATNCPAPARPARRQRRQPRDQNSKTEEIVNYEISRTTKTEVIEAGRVNRISAAVLVDGTYSKNDKGEVVYQPRAKEEIDRIAALVRSAIGFDAKRGDQVEVVNLRFAETPAGADQRADRLDELSAIHQGRHHARRRAGRDGAARPDRAAAGGAAAGAPHRHAGGRPAAHGAARPAPPACRRDRRCRRRRSRARRHDHFRRRPAAASPQPAAPTSRSSAATRRSPSPTAPRP